MVSLFLQGKENDYSDCDSFLLLNFVGKMIKLFKVKEKQRENVENAKKQTTAELPLLKVLSRVHGLRLRFCHAAAESSHGPILRHPDGKDLEAHVELCNKRREEACQSSRHWSRRHAHMAFFSIYIVNKFQRQIGYNLVPMIARGLMLGPDQPVILHMLDIEPAAEALEAVKMELADSAFSLLKGVLATTDVVEACNGVDIALMVGGFPRKDGMERKDVMKKNVAIYKAQASALEQHAAANCKVVVVANPANTNALILREFAPSIPPKNITCLTRLDHNRALGQISEKLNVPVSSVKNVIVWGNHSSTQYPDANHAIIVDPGSGRERSAREMVADDNWLKTEFQTIVRQRGAAIIKARKLSSALSAASAVCDHMRDWILGTPEGTWVSMGVCSDGSYGIEPGLLYSFPVTCRKGQWSIVQGLNIDEFSRARMDATARELAEEKLMAYSCLQVEK
ncbi:hypothetical protein SAY86_021758 [Trapa natans]|uniref:malate dehydrogenase n=1 Tax=Trapa natans TaxID=22666 RepID=A0AAN7RKG2_TRANT|nr:hypothetical protein SAY86_021758 [Trapa natans]